MNAVTLKPLAPGTKPAIKSLLESRAPESFVLAQPKDGMDARRSETHTCVLP